MIPGCFEYEYEYRFTEYEYEYETELKTWVMTSPAGQAIGTDGPLGRKRR